MRISGRQGASGFAQCLSRLRDVDLAEDWRLAEPLEDWRDREARLLEARLPGAFAIACEVARHVHAARQQKRREQDRARHPWIHADPDLLAKQEELSGTQANVAGIMRWLDVNESS